MPRDVHRSGGGSPPSPRSREAQPAGPRLPGALAAVGIFLVTLAAAAADSYIGIGLGRITLVALTASTAVATVLVRRRDLVTTLIAPPLVFMAVALLNIALAPSATFTLPTVATLLIQGFPAMAIATGVALVLTLVRLVTRR
jgi:NADH:ubiquinone oxidoreductase subunit K